MKTIQIPLIPIQVPNYADNSDDDLVAAAEAAEKQAKLLKKRSSRSPSLSKSSLVTTSYKHTIEPLVERNDDDVILLNDSSDAEYSSDMLEAIRKPNTPTTKISAAVDSRRKTLQSGPSVVTNLSSIIKPISNYGLNEAEKTASYRRRYTTNAPIPQSYGVDDSDEDILKRVETPFLSDFTRRLAELKAQPLIDNDNSKYEYKSPKTTSAYYREYRAREHYDNNRDGYSTKIKPTTSLLKAQQTETAWNKIEKKIRLPLLIIFGIIALVTVYVFFFSNY